MIKKFIFIILFLAISITGFSAEIYTGTPDFLPYGVNSIGQRWIISNMYKVYALDHQGLIGK